MNNPLKLKYAFPSFLHTEVEEVDKEVCDWIRNHKLLDTSQVRQYKEAKITWFSARLYPYCAKEKLVVVAKLFCLLFLIDDYTDVASHKTSFWKKIQQDLESVIKGKVPLSRSELIKCFAETWKQLVLLGGPKWLGHAKEVFVSFLEAGSWEASIRQSGTIPSIADYLRYRIEFSGVRIAFLLIPLVDKYVDVEICQDIRLNSLRNQAGKVIFLANDLMSYQKEMDNGDWNNLVRLVQREEDLSLPEAFDKVFDMHYRELAKFHQLERGWLNCDTPEVNAYVVALRHMIAGSAEWSSEDTDRYILGNNGQSKY